MDEWIRKSIEIANSPGYLDRLHEVYPVTLEAKRKIPPELKGKLQVAYQERDESGLISILLKLPKFPIKDPYVAFLRKRPFFPDYNAETVHRIAQRLLSMDFEAIVEGIEEPKEFNRQIGTLFKRWLPQLGYPILPKSEFERHKGTVLLRGSNGQLKEYANRKLGCNLRKGKDLLARVGSTYVVGEAKFLTDYGGHQNAQFAEAMRFLVDVQGNAMRILIIDGVAWIKDSTNMYRTLCQLHGGAMTALLLKDFLDSLA